MFKENQKLQELRDKEKSTIAEIHGTRAALSNQDSRLRKLDQNSLKQQGILFNQARVQWNDKNSE